MNKRIERLKRIDEAIIDRDLLFCSASTHLLSIFFITDSEMRITYISPASRSLFGFLSTEMLGEAFCDFFVDSESLKAHPAFQPSVEIDQKLQVIVLEMRRKDTSTFFGEISVTHTHTDNLYSGMIGMIRDVSLQITQERKLLKKNRLLQAINEYSLSLTDVPNKHLLDYIGKRLLLKLNCVLAVISFFDKKTNELVIQHLESLEELPVSVRHLLPQDTSSGGRFPVSSDIAREMIENKFLVTRELNQLSLGHIPEAICRDIKQDLGIDWFMGVVLVHSGELQGTMVVGGKSDQVVPEKEEVLAFSGVTANAIKRMRAEENLIKSEDRFRKLVKNSNDFFEILDSDGTETFVSGSVESITGYNPNEIIGSNAFYNIHPDDIEHLKDVRRSILENPGIPFRSEYRLRCKDNSWKYLEAVGSNFLDDPVIQGIIVNVRDVSERKKMQQMILGNELKFRAYLEKAPISITVTDDRGRFLEVNPAACSMTGYTETELIGSILIDQIHADDRKTVEEKFSDLAESKQVEVCVRYRHKNGHYIWLDIVAVSIDADRSIGFSRDVTERLNAEAERNRLERHLQQAQKLESLGIMAGGVAHDFNNVLMAMLGHTELSLHKIPASSPARSHLQQLQKNIHRASELTRQMLAYAGKASFVKDVIHVDSILVNLIDLIKASISRKIMLSVSLDDNLPPIEGDPNQIQHVLMNLIMNAAEAIGETSGIIRIEGSVLGIDLAKTQQYESYKELTPGNFLKLVVSDTGCGMDEETIARVFEPFFTTKFAGRGLGLASVQGIIRGHDGALHVSSSPGKGSVFEVILPITKRSFLAENQTNDVTMDDTMKNLTIMVVDDEDDLREICVEMLETMGFKVVSAANGREAIELVKNGIGIDLALLDFTMPEINGVETFQQMQSINPDIKTILTSGFSEEEVSTRFHENGFCGFLSKPFTFQELRNALAQLNL